MRKGPVHPGRSSGLEDRIAAVLAAENVRTSADGDVALREALDEALLAAERTIVELTANAPQALADRYRAVLELHELRDELTERHLQRRLQTFVRVQGALARLRELQSVEAIVQGAPAEVAAACDFDRVAIYRVAGPDMLAEAFYVRGDPDGARAMLEHSRANPGKFTEQILETEMIRRRIPMIVRDALNHPSTPKSLVERYQTTCYVAAPIMPEGRVIGFVHADKALQKPGDPDCLDEFDRDVLWAFAEGLGYAIERAQLVERLHRQGHEVARLMAHTQAVVSDYLKTKVELVSGPFDATATTRTATAIFAGSAGGGLASPLERTLTRRELEVLELLAVGSSNAHIADKLFITESTAKSHVARILRKLGAGNRVEATAIYLSARDKVEKPPVNRHMSA